MIATPHPPDIPMVETAHLILRGPHEADFESVAAFGASARSRFAGGPSFRHDAWRGFLAGFGHWVLRGYGVSMLEDRATGRAAGRVGVIFHDGWDEPERSWHLFDGFEGRGYAFEAAEAARDCAARRHGLDCLISWIDPENARSIRLAKRLGAICERAGALPGQPAHVYRHPKVAA